MTPARRIALLAAVVVIAVVAFIALKPDDTSKKQSTSTSRTPRKPEPSIQNVRVTDGKPVGGLQELSFAKGATVAFVVTSDVADVVHVHGYDVMKHVEPGRPARFRFRAKIDGEFEVELEERGEEIASLKVEP